MSYVIDFGHGENGSKLDYILRLRAVNNQVVDLARNTWTAQSNVSVTNNDFIYFNNGYLTYNTNGVISEGEDFTFSVWMQMDNVPPSGKEYFLLGSKIDPDSPRLEYGDFSFVSIYNYTHSWAQYPNTFRCTIESTNSSGSWDGIVTDSVSSMNTFNSNINHFSCTRKNNVCYAFYNGNLTYTYTMNHRVFSRVNIPTCIGTWNLVASTASVRPPINCKIKDFCIIKGTALWTSNFTPPSDYLPDKW